MKKIALTFVLLLFVLQTMQAQIKMASKEDIDKFLKSKTYVVLEDNPFSVFNALVSDQLKDIWKITPFEIISYEEFEKKMGDASASFLFVSQAMFGKTKSAMFKSEGGAGDDNNYNYAILNLVLGDASKNLNKMPNICIVPVAYEEVDEDTYEFKLPALIKFMCYYVNFSKSNPGKDIQQIVKENQVELKNYELWFRQGDLAPEVNTLDKIKKYYPYSVRIASEEEIMQAISLNNPKVAFLHKVGPEGTAGAGSACWKFIVTAKEGKPLYFDNHQISADKPDAFLAEDFLNMAK
ncbi:MAG: hypothetical protein WCQ95_10950 [Bacteroidota bacterium]